MMNKMVYGMVVFKVKVSHTWQFYSGVKKVLRSITTLLLLQYIVVNILYIEYIVVNIV